MANSGATLSTRSGPVRLGFVAPALLGSVGDPDGTRTVTSIIMLLVALGIGLVMLAVWLRRQTRPDPELLSPLEVMSDRKWRGGDPVWQRRRLDQIRPVAAVPLAPSSAPPDIDQAFDDGPSATGFDDLRGAGLESAEPAVDEDGIGVEPVASQMTVGGASNPDMVSLGLAGTNTPHGLSRLDLDDRSDGDLDPEALAAAIVKLDAELDHDPP